MRPTRARVLALVSSFAMGCGTEAPPGSLASPAEDAGAPCEPGERPVGAQCMPAGIDDLGCPASELALEGGGCEPAGIPPEKCADGFAPDGTRGCLPILPADACGIRQLAVPGETSCRVVAPCEPGTW